MSQLQPLPSPPPAYPMSADLPTLSVLIPAYNSLPALMRCLGSLSATVNPARTELLVQDDASPEYNLTQQPLPPGANPQRNEVNVGFAENVNRAALRARGEYLLILNQDCRAFPYDTDGEAVRRLLRPDWADAMLRVFVEHEDAGLVGPRLVFPDGSVQSVGGLFDGGKGPYHRYLGWSNPEDRRISRTEPVSWVTGAAMMIRRADFVECGGLDAATYIRGYFEDVDLCMKVRFELGKRVYYCAESTLVHEVGSTGGNPRYFMQNSLRFHQRWNDRIVPDTNFVYVNY